MKTQIQDSILEGPIQIPNGNEIRSGVIYIANEARITESNFSEPVTTYITGWRDPDNVEQTIIDIAGNAVPVGRRFEYGTTENAEAFLSELDDERAIGASFKRVEYTGGKVNAKTKNYGLMIRIDRDNLPEGQNLQQAIQYRAAKLKARINRNKLRRVVTALLSIDAGTAKVWSTAAGKDPDGDVISLLQTCGDSSGIHPNAVLYGSNSWTLRQLSLRAQNTPAGWGGAMMTPDQLAALLGVDMVKVSRERYQSAANAKSKIVGDVVVAYNRSMMPDEEDPSNIKVFSSPTAQGGLWATYVVDDGVKFVDVIVEHYALVVATATVGAKKYTITSA